MLQQGLKTVLEYGSREGNMMSLLSLDKVKGTQFKITKKDCFPDYFYTLME